MFKENRTIFWKKLGTEATGRKSVSGDQVNRKWISVEQENRIILPRRNKVTKNLATGKTEVTEN
jgi:hypothetical protein